MKFLMFLLLLFFNDLIIFSQLGTDKVNYFSNNAFEHPIVGRTVEYYKGLTCIACQMKKEDPYILAYDYEKDKWIGYYKAGVSLLGKIPKKNDNHCKPTLIVDGLGYNHLFFGGHCGTKELGENKLGNYNAGKQIHVVSNKPMDISSWEVVDNLNLFVTSSQFLKMEDEDIYLFYRHVAHRSNWVY